MTLENSGWFTPPSMSDVVMFDLEGFVCILSETGVWVCFEFVIRRVANLAEMSNGELSHCRLEWGRPVRFAQSAIIVWINTNRSQLNFGSQPRSDRSDNPQVSHNQAGSTNVIPSCRLIEHFVLTFRDNFAHKIYQTELTLFVLIGNQKFWFKTKSRARGLTRLLSHRRRFSGKTSIACLLTYCYINQFVRRRVIHSISSIRQFEAARNRTNSLWSDSVFFLHKKSLQSISRRLSMLPSLLCGSVSLDPTRLFNVSPHMKRLMELSWKASHSTGIDWLSI